jgi:hypothetical protein
MDEPTDQEGGEDLSPDLVKKCTHLKWDFLAQGIKLASLECPFQKLYIYKNLKEDLEMHEIRVILLRKWKVSMKNIGNQNPICSLPFDQYEACTPN